MTVEMLVKELMQYDLDAVIEIDIEVEEDEGVSFLNVLSEECEHFEVSQNNITNRVLLSIKVVE